MIDILNNDYEMFRSNFVLLLIIFCKYFMQKSFAVVATGETALYGNILIQKGVIG